MGGYTTIAVSPKTKELLKNLGRKGETYDEIIQRLLRAVRLRAFVAEQRKILREDEFVDVNEI